MTFRVAAIRECISQLLEGTIGSVRTMTSGTMLRGTFDGQPVQASRAKELQTATARHRFDVEVGPMRNHPATSLSNLHSRRIGLTDIVVRVTSKLSPPNMATQRATDIAAILTDCNAAARALAYPRNLTQTSAGDPTDIVGGCLRESEGASMPRVDKPELDVRSQTATTRIVAQAIVLDEDGPLDALSSSARAALVYAHWTGGRLLSSYTGPLMLGKRATSGDTRELSSLTEAVAFGDGEAVLLSATRDQSGNANHFTATSDAASGTLVQADGTPYTNANGALAYLLPDVAVAASYVPSYERSGSLGLPLDSSALEFWHDMDTEPRTDTLSANGNVPGCYPILFTTDEDYDTLVPFYGLVRNNGVFPNYQLARFNAPSWGADFYTDENGDDDFEDAYLRCVIPAGATHATVQVYLNGAALTDRVVVDTGSHTLVGATEVGLYAERDRMKPVAAMLVFSGNLAAADVAVVQAFFAGLQTA